MMLFDYRGILTTGSVARNMWISDEHADPIGIPSDNRVQGSIVGCLHLC